MGQNEIRPELACFGTCESAKRRPRSPSGLAEPWTCLEEVSLSCALQEAMPLLTDLPWPCFDSSFKSAQASRRSTA